MKTLSCAAALILAGTSFTSAAVIYDEGVSGDLSGAFATPTAVTISNGTNSVVGQVGLNGDTGATNGQDADYFTFTVGPGLSITSLTVDSYTAVGSGSGSFLGFTAGSLFGGQTGGDIDASVIFNAGSGEILDDLREGVVQHERVGREVERIPGRQHGARLEDVADAATDRPARHVDRRAAAVDDLHVPLLGFLGGRRRLDRAER